MAAIHFTQTGCGNPFANEAMLPHPSSIITPLLQHSHSAHPAILSQTIPGAPAATGDAELEGDVKGSPINTSLPAGYDLGHSHGVL